jgi:hypothetical protein
MGKKKYNPIVETVEPKKREVAKREPGKKGEAPFKILFFLSILLVVILFVAFVVPWNSNKASTNDSKIHELLGNSYVELGRKESATDIDDPSFKITYWTWSDRNGTWGYCTELPIPGYPNILLVVDSNVRIISMIETGDLGVGVRGKAEFKDALEKYNDKTLIDFTYLENTIHEGETAKFRGLLRDSAMKSMKVLYIEVNGESMFNSNFPQGLKFASVGTKLKAWTVELHGGGTISSKDFKGRKYAFLATSSCGSCRNTVVNISQRLQNEGGMSTDQIIFIYTSKEEKLSYLQKQMNGEQLVLDVSQRGFSKKISLTESTPCIMLVDGNGIVNAKAGSQLLNDANSLNKILEGYFKTR